MKITNSLRTAVLATAMVAFTLGSGLAQGVTPQTQCANIATEHAIGVTNNPNTPMGVQQVQTIQTDAMRDRIAASIATATTNIVAGSSIDYAELAEKHVVRFTAAAGGESLPVIEQHLLNVVVKYDARPIGGILTVRVELVPAFGGIGTACRPIVSKQFSRAVDNLDDEAIASTIKELTTSLGQQYASKQ